MDRCRKCWKKIWKGLRCDICIKYVDSELRWETNQTFNFYFKYYKQKWKSLVQCAEKNLNRNEEGNSVSNAQI